MLETNQCLVMPESIQLELGLDDTSGTALYHLACLNHIEHFAEQHTVFNVDNCII